MLSIQDLTRREAVRVGGLGFSGLLWADCLRARAATATSAKKRPGKAKSCILIFNYGGPSHLDTFDLKPDAPPEIRGEFKPIASRTPGLLVSEHLPRLAAMTDRCAVVRSVTHRDNDHAIGAYLALTGHSHPKNAILGIEPPATPLDMPSMGSVVSKLRPAERPVFTYVTLGELRHLGHNDGMGSYGGCLGRIHDAFAVPFERSWSGKLDMGAAVSVLASAGGSRMKDRRELQTRMKQSAPARDDAPGTRHLDGFTKRAYELLASPACRDAFDLDREPEKVRESYGPTHFSRNCLLARRLVEAGVPVVTVYSVGNRDWDTHGRNFHHLKQSLLPVADRGVSALLKDLEGRGMLDETLVVWMGDMGRTPRINKDAGRDHWSFCYSILMAGGGIRGGQVLGSSDKSAAYPSVNPVGPPDIAATIFHSLGIDPQSHVTDQQGRPFVVGTGKLIEALL